MKCQRSGTTYRTGSVKGITDIEQVTFNATIYYYVKTNINNKVYYYGNDGRLTDKSCAKLLTNKDANKIVNSLRAKYGNAIIFQTTKQL